MRRSFGLIVRTVPFLAALAAAPAAADDLGGGLAVNGGAALVSDYRFRGISQTDRKFAIQGRSRLATPRAFMRRSGALRSTIMSQMGATPRSTSSPATKRRSSRRPSMSEYSIIITRSGGANTDFAEPYVRLTQAFGPVSLTGSVACAPKQKALTVDGVHSEDNLYLAGDLAYAIPKTPVSLTAHFGHSLGRAT